MHSLFALMFFDSRVLPFHMLSESSLFGSDAVFRTVTLLLGLISCHTEPVRASIGDASPVLGLLFLYS